MAKLTPKMITEMKELGLYAEFLTLKDGLVAEGKTKQDAENILLPKFKARIDGARIGPERSEMQRRTCDEATSIRWAARNIDNPLVTMDDCPDPAAWNLLTYARRCTANADDFMRNFWSKLVPSRSQLEADRPVEADGLSQMEMIDRILAARAAAEAAQ